MTSLTDITALGVSPAWPSRAAVIRSTEEMTPWAMDQAVAYNRRADTKNVRNILPSASYDPFGYRKNLDAIALALQEKKWEPTMAEALGYQLFGDRMKFFWHHQFHDLSTLPRVPLEILLLFRLRELAGLSNPVLHHPLMDAPFDRLPESQPAYVADDLMRGTLTRIYKDWPNFEDVVSLHALRRTLIRSTGS
jgi:hypothetical protein